MTRNTRMAFSLLVLAALLLACDRILPTDQVTPVPSAPPLSIPTPLPPTSTPLPTPVPDQGPLPRVLTEVDFGLATGDGYKPQTVALDASQGLVAVLNEYYEDNFQGSVSVVDVQRGQVVDTVPLPWSSIGPLAIGGGRIYVRHEENGEDYLSAIDVATHQVMATVTTDFLYYRHPLVVDPDAGRLYAVFSDHIETRSADDLSLLGAFPFARVSDEIGLALDSVADRLYLTLGERVAVIQASTLRQLDTFNHPNDAPLQTCFLDAVARRLYVQGDTAILTLDADTGKVLARTVPEASNDYWRLVGVDGAGRLYVHYSQEATHWLAALDASSGESVSQVAVRYDDQLVLDVEREVLIDTHYAKHTLDLRDVPQLTARQTIPLGIELLDLATDNDAGRLYLSDSAGQVHVLDTANYHEIATLPGRGLLTLDAANQRLYVAEDYGSEVTVLDTASLTVAGTIPEGGYVAVDSAGGRVFVGHNIDFSGRRPGDSGVRVFDANTLQQTATLPQSGIPTYNPVADEVYVLNYTAYAFDGRTFAPLGELTPDIGAQQLKWCNGCDKVTAVHVHPEHNVTVVELTTLSAGKGAGLYPPPRFFDAATRAPLETPALTVEHTCWDTPVLTGPIDGRTYETVEYSRYLFHDNLIVRDATGRVETWMDGITAGLLNPVTRQAYVPRWPDILVLDLATLTPLGNIASYCLHTLDPDHDRLYAMRGAVLIVLTNRGAAPTPPPPAVPVTQLPSIDSIVLSPDFAADRTIFVAGGGGVFRSTDSGLSWQQLHGGLPHKRYYNYYAPSISLALSPNFAADRTLFAGIFVGDSVGYGVYRSTDAGDTWQPTWSGLTHLRVHKITVSPDFATDHTLVAHSRYQNLTEWTGGQSLFRSTDGGQTWEMIASGTESDGSDLPPIEEVLPALDRLVRFRSGGYGQTIERTTDGGETWQTVFTLPPGKYPLEIVTSPSFEQDRSVYVLFYTSLLRSTDGGQTWESFQDPALAREDDSDTWLAALALAPADGGGHTLFLGRSDGQFIVRASETLAWQPAISAPTPTPIPSPGPSPSPTVIATPCAPSPAAIFAAAYPRASACLGCAVADAAEITLGEQAFERGRMFWREDARAIYVLFEDGTWLSFPDTYSDDQPSDDPTLVPPPGLQQPIRGFGKVWREQLGGPDSAIGWAREGERGHRGWWQPFSGGLMLTGGDGTVYALCADGTWR
jgi:DNA-binding beta-propeller fold protein YncE